METKKYEAFVRTVELGSLTKAGEIMGCTQSAVSHMIQSLEEELGLPLLMRSRGGVKLTDGGERLLPSIRAILNFEEQLCQNASAIRGMTCGTVRIGMFTSVAVHWMPGMIKTFCEKYPGIDFRLNSGDYYDVEQWIRDGTVDMGFVALPTELDCRCIPLRDDRLLAVIPKNHRFANLMRFPLNQAKDEPFISLLKNSDHDARKALKAAGVTPNIRFTTKDDYAIIAMVENGLGISIMPELLLKGRTDNVCAIELEPSSKRTIALALSAASESAEAVKRFALHIVEWVDNYYAGEENQ